MKTFLQNPRIRSKHYEKGLDIKTIEFVNSDSYDLIQFSDLLMGAIGYHYNERHLKPEASQHKSELAMYIAEKIHRNDLVFETDKKGYKNFNLWKFTGVNKVWNL